MEERGKRNGRASHPQPLFLGVLSCVGLLPRSTARNPQFLDKNFAGVFILWDRLFGTFAEEPDEDPCADSNGLVYGLIPPLDSLDPLETQFHVWRSVYVERVVRSA